VAGENNADHAAMSLNDDSPMPYGKHTGKPMAQVPADYLLWLWDDGGQGGGLWKAKSPVSNYIRAHWNTLLKDAPDFIAKHPPEGALTTVPPREAPKKKEKRAAFNFFICRSCTVTDPMELEMIKDHLSTVHKINELRGARSLLMHANCEDGHLYSYEWKLGDVLIEQSKFSPK
jgi:hypothetical protein